MIRGHVNRLSEPVVPLKLLLQSKLRLFHGVIDTGFNGYLSVPENLIKSDKHWNFIGFEDYEIATGSIVRQKIYLGHIAFIKPQLVYAVTSNSKDILIGTKLLQKTRLTINFATKKIVIT